VTPDSDDPTVRTTLVARNVELHDGDHADVAIRVFSDGAMTAQVRLAYGRSAWSPPVQLHEQL
jgi:hypothetical protein